MIFFGLSFGNFAIRNNSLQSGRGSPVTMSDTKYPVWTRARVYRGATSSFSFFTAGFFSFFLADVEERAFVAEGARPACCASS